MLTSIWERTENTIDTKIWSKSATECHGQLFDNFWPKGFDVPNRVILTELTQLKCLFTLS